MGNAVPRGIVGQGLILQVQVAYISCNHLFCVDTRATVKQMAQPVGPVFRDKPRIPDWYLVTGKIAPKYFETADKERRMDDTQRNALIKAYRMVRCVHYSR
jgi:hypothetical protein